MSEKLFEIVKLFLDKYSSFLLPVAIVLGIVCIIDFFSVSRIERALENSKIKIFRVLVNEVLLCVYIILMALPAMDNIGLLEDNPFLTFIFYFIQIFLFFVSLIISQGIKFKKRSIITRLIDKIQKFSYIIIIVSPIITYAWFVYTINTLLYAFKVDYELSRTNPIEIIIDLYVKYRNDFVILLVITFMIYFLLRLLIYPTILLILNKIRTRYKFCIKFENENEDLNNYYLLKVNYKYLYVCRKNSFYSDAEVVVVEKSRVKRFTVKYDNQK
jgi:hypothetical protein